MASKEKASLILSGLWFGFQAGVALQAWLTHRSEEFPRMKRENRKLAAALPTKKVNLLLKALDNEEKAKASKWEWEKYKEACTSIQSDLKASGIDYSIPTYLREKEQATTSGDA
jgi:hypothetical protein